MAAENRGTRELFMRKAIASKVVGAQRAKVADLQFQQWTNYARFREILITFQLRSDIIPVYVASKTNTR